MVVVVIENTPWVRGVSKSGIQNLGTPKKRTVYRRAQFSGNSISKNYGVFIKASHGVSIHGRPISVKQNRASLSRSFSKRFSLRLLPEDLASRLAA